MATEQAPGTPQANTDATTAANTSATGQPAASAAGSTVVDGKGKGESLLAGTGTTEKGGQPPADQKPVEGPPEKYEFKPVEGFELNTEAIEKFTPLAKELGLSQGKAQKLVDLYAEMVHRQEADQDNKLEVQRREWRAAVEKDPKHKENLAYAKKAASAFFDDEGRALLEGTWLGDHPAILRGLEKAGRAIAEDPFREGTGAPKAAKNLAETLYGKKS